MAAQLLIFWDYDAQWGADRSRSAGHKTWGLLEFEHTDELLDLHDRYGIPACFAVVGSVALPGARPYHDRNQIRRINEAGHEIASHSLRHEWLPALDRSSLLQTLIGSKDALEQCIGSAVRSFVPPFNQPFDYAEGLSFSLSERRSSGRSRTCLARLCDALRETGYSFCRVAYRPVLQRLAEKISGRRLDRRASLEEIHGVHCVRLNTPGGFDRPALAMLTRCIEAGAGMTVVYGHPHSLHAGNTQDVRLLVPFLQAVANWRRAGVLDVCRPLDLIPSAVVT